MFHIRTFTIKFNLYESSLEKNVNESANLIQIPSRVYTRVCVQYLGNEP